MLEEFDSRLRSARISLGVYVMLGGQEWEVGVRGFWVFRPRTGEFQGR